MDMLNSSLHSTGSKITIVGEENTNEETETIDNSSECLSELAQTAFIDPNLQYQLQQETIKDGHITYRVVPISSVEKLNDNGPIISDVNFSSHNPNATILQTSLQSLHPSSYIAMPGLESIRNSPRVALYSSDISDNSLLNNANALYNSNYRDKALIQGNAGHLVLMMSPELLQNHKLSSQNNPMSNNDSKGGKDEKRRFIHNEVERRRRDKINTWITKLSKIVPDCNSDQSKQGQVCHLSKGGILAKTADYIHELKSANESLFRALKESERAGSELERLRSTNLELASKLALFRSQAAAASAQDPTDAADQSELHQLRQRFKELKQENCILMAFIKQHFPNVEIQITHTVRRASNAGDAPAKLENDARTQASTHSVVSAPAIEERSITPMDEGVIGSSSKDDRSDLNCETRLALPHPLNSSKNV